MSLRYFERLDDVNVPGSWERSDPVNREGASWE
jgi:hypothetical protein